MISSSVLFASTSIFFAGMLAPVALAQCCTAPKAAPSITSAAKGGSSAANMPAAIALLAAATGTVSAEPINKVCPIKEGEVDLDSPTREFKGVTIGFCCPGCEAKWDKKSEEEKMALLTKNDPDTVTAIQKVAKSTGQKDAKAGQSDAAALASNPAVKIARAYLAACGKADANALDALFLDKGRATVSENASDEGTWETYRDHHLLPELKEMPGFVMTLTKEDVQVFGASSIVRQIGSFTVPDPNHKEVTKKYRAAVTYVVVDEGGTHKIAHLHWSSRAEKKPDAAAATTPDAGHGNSAGHEHK